MYTCVTSLCYSLLHLHCATGFPVKTFAYLDIIQTESDFKRCKYMSLITYNRKYVALGYA